MIQLQNLSRHFGGRFRRAKLIAVEKLNLTIQPGELFGLVGPDGAGKTTTLRILAGILKPSSGEAMVNGHDVVEDAEAIKQELGYMPQQFGLYPDLTVDENLNFICDVFGIVGDEREQRIQELLDFTNLHEFRGRLGRQLSGGMQKKLSLTAALVHRPKVLLLDEPTTGVDPVARREFWDILTTLHVEGSTVIVSTPYMDEAEHCENLAFISYGRIIAEGAPGMIKAIHTPGDVVQVTPANAASAMRILSNAHESGALGDSVTVSLYGAQIHILTHDADRTRQRMITLLDDQGERYTDADIIPPSLEDAFIRLVQAQSA